MLYRYILLHYSRWCFLYSAPFLFPPHQDFLGSQASLWSKWCLVLVGPKHCRLIASCCLQEHLIHHLFQGYLLELREIKQLQVNFRDNWMAWTCAKVILSPWFLNILRKPCSCKWNSCVMMCKQVIKQEHSVDYNSH